MYTRGIKHLFLYSSLDLQPILSKNKDKIKDLTLNYIFPIDFVQGFSINRVVIGGNIPIC